MSYSEMAEGKIGISSRGKRMHSLRGGLFFTALPCSTTNFGQVELIGREESVEETT